MHERDISAPSTNGRGNQPPRKPVTDPASDDLDNDQVRRWAALIVDRSETSISHFSSRNRVRVEAEVRRLLRSRLMRLVARVIAQDIVAEENVKRKSHD